MKLQNILKENFVKATYSDIKEKLLYFADTSDKRNFFSTIKKMDPKTISFEIEIKVLVKDKNNKKIINFNKVNQQNKNVYWKDADIT